MDKEIDEIPFPEEEVKINPVKREFEKDVVKMKQLTTVKIEERGAAFHEKKDKNKKVNLGGPTKRKPPKSKPKNRGQQKQKAKARKKGK